jgi:hypothetical protein
MEVYKIDPLIDRRWAEFIGRCQKASVFHTKEWLESIRRTYGYEPVVFTTSSPMEELRNGLVFCRIQSWLTGSRMVSLPFSDHCEPLVDSARELKFLINRLQADTAQQKTYLEFRPLSGQFEIDARQAGFGPADAFSYHRIDLRPSLDAIFRGLNRDSAQRRIRRADRSGILFKCGRSQELLRDFYKLLVLTRRRHLLPPQPYIWFRNLVDCMGEALDIRVAYKGVVPIATLLTLTFRNTTYYKYGCSDSRFHNLAAIPALLWNTIQAAKAAGSQELDLGRSEHDNKGLITFKNHWAPEHTLVYWRYPAAKNASMAGSWKLRAAKRAFGWVPSRILPIMGRFLYRHAG